MNHSMKINGKLQNGSLQEETVTGSEALLRSLLLEGVDCVFGYPGGSVLYLYDAIHHNPRFRHILTRHEQGAIHAADGYARTTGKAGVCIATSGPGATNLITGLATAYMDSVPLVAITGNVPTAQLGTDAFQEADIVSMTMPITKNNWLVQSAADIPRIVREAFHIATTGRKGPVLIDIPKDVSNERCLFHYPETIPIKGYKPEVSVDMEAVERLQQALRFAAQPVLLVGGGAVSSEAGSELTRLADRCGMPVVSTLLGLGCVPDDHRLFLGMAGMHGSYAANKALQNADLIIAAGARFDDRVTMNVRGFAPNAKTIAHIDIDAAEIGKIVEAHIPLAGDCKQIAAHLASNAAPSRSVGDWLERVMQWKREQPLRYTDSDTELKPQYVIEMISKSTRGEAIVTTDVGQHQMWAAQFFQVKHPRSWVTSGGLGTMGFGFPAAIGAQVAHPERLVISINGDGGMQMCAQELAICAIHRLPVKIVVLNNRTLGMVRQQQEQQYGRRFSHIDLSGSPDFVKLAEAYGVKGLRAASKEEAQRVWQEAVNTQGPVLIDFVVAKTENVYPTIINGNTLDDMILEQ
jgi:acetolactate synthase-1/2/3 large subunit